jgi:Ca2+-binding EF-hand superfamily protein
MIDDVTKGAPEKPTEKDIKAEFDKLDADHSGALEFDELVPLVKGII